jgi:large subunit ribosomal protein L6
MSRVGKLPVPLPKGVTARVDGGALIVKGPKGELSQAYDASAVAVEVAASQVTVTRSSDERRERSLHGLYRALFANMVRGVTDGYRRVLEIAGVGYRAEVQGRNLALFVGFAGPKVLAIPEGIQAVVEKNTRIVLTSYDRQRIGQFAADVRRVRPPEPYKGKGIKYEEETIRKKAGKAAAK